MLVELGGAEKVKKEADEATQPARDDEQKPDINSIVMELMSNNPAT